MLRSLSAALLACASLASFAQQTPSAPATSSATQSAQAIMARVAANQDRSESERTHYVYLQHARVASRKGKTIQCEEITDSRVIPSPAGSQQNLLKLDGRLLVKHHYQSYTELPPQKHDRMAGHDDDINVTVGGDSDMDRELVEDMRNSFVNNKSKDGIGAGLFPLTTRSQADYQFRLAGEESLNGREVFHIIFEPRDKSEFLWKGDAFIDTAAYQPVLVRTIMSRKIPFAVRTLLGTSLPGLGFTVIYAPQPGGLWFPTSFGTEFKLHVLFFLNREITLSAQNKDFEQTHVTTTILPADVPAPAAPQP